MDFSRDIHLEVTPLLVRRMVRRHPGGFGSMGLLCLLGLGLGPAAATAVPATSEAIIGGVLRVQALSPTLVRAEEKGPDGFEDRDTFTAKNR